ncbi:MAG TPA: hypothetical protein VIL20_01905, partial [Sandaracinaceae bacterium]
MTTSKPALIAAVLAIASACSEPAPAIEPETASPAGAASSESAPEPPSAAAEAAEPAAAALDGPPPEIERPYREGVDAQAEIDAAVARART